MNRRTVLLLQALACGAAMAGPAGAEERWAPRRLRLENAGAGRLAAGIATLGQSFAPGEIPAGSGLVARIGRATMPAQVDAKTTWPDGSIRMAVLAVQRPELGAGAFAEVTLERVAAPDVVPAIDLTAALQDQSFAVELAIQGRVSIRIDVLAALRAALASGTASFWRRGNLVSEARVAVDIPNSAMRLVFDVAAFKGGGFAVDVQFANDRAMESVGGRLAYTATVTLNGQPVARETIAEHLQYQSWHCRLASSSVHGGQGIGEPARGWLNIRHDVAALKRIGAVAQYDLTLRIPDDLLTSFLAATRAPGWQAPLSAKGVHKFMPAAGGRSDIGITTQPNTAWLISQDPRVAAYALGQANASVPWRYWDAANRTWLHSGNYPMLWIQSRGGANPPGRPGDRASRGPAQFAEWTGPDSWAPEAAHQPDLYFVPYLLTGQRWLLDNLCAQAAWNTVWNWPGDAQQGERFNTITGKFDLVVRNVEVRAAAWALRQLEHVAWAAPDGSSEQRHFRGAAEANWTWLVAQLPSWGRQQGEMHGYIPNGVWGGRMGAWQQDYFASIAILCAARGRAEAAQVLDWMKNFLIGRFEQDPRVFNPRDGVSGSTVIGRVNPATGWVPNWDGVIKTWAEFGQATRAANASNGEGWERSGGNFGMWALATLAGMWLLSGDARARTAYEKLIALNPPYTTAAAFAREPSSPVTIPGRYGR